MSGNQEGAGGAEAHSDRTAPPPLLWTRMWETWHSFCYSMDTGQINCDQRRITVVVLMSLSKHDCFSKSDVNNSNENYNDISHYLAKIDLWRSPASQSQFYRERQLAKCQCVILWRLQLNSQWNQRSIEWHFSFPFFTVRWLHSFRGGLSNLHTQASYLYAKLFE